MKKISWLLIMQAWAMLWVVIGHSPLLEGGIGGGDPLYANVLKNDIAYAFHMQLFIFVSGWLFYMTRISSSRKEWTYVDIMKDKFLRLCIPLMVFTAVTMFLKVAFPGEMARETTLSLTTYLKALIIPYEGPARELWFILTIFILFSLAPLWKLSFKKVWSEVVALLALTALYFWHPLTDVLAIRTVCMHALWFYSGMLICKYSVFEKIISFKWILLLSGLIIFLIAQHTNLPLLPALGGIVFSCGLAFILDEYIPKMFFTFRNYTYQIYLMGIFAQMFIKILYRHIHIPYIAAYLLCIAMGLYVPVVVSKIIERINWKPLSLCVGLKTK